MAAPLRGEVQRYRLNHVDRLVRTDLTFTHPEDKFDLREWWTKTLEDHGRVEQVRSCDQVEPMIQLGKEVADLGLALRMRSS